MGGTPPFIGRGHGSHIWDEDGNEYIGYLGVAVGGTIAGGAKEGVNTPLLPSTVAETTPSGKLQNTYQNRSSPCPVRLVLRISQAGQCPVAARTTEAGPIRKEGRSMPGL